MKWKQPLSVSKCGRCSGKVEFEWQNGPFSPAENVVDWYANRIMETFAADACLVMDFRFDGTHMNVIVDDPVRYGQLACLRAVRAFLAASKHFRLFYDVRIIIARMIKASKASEGWHPFPVYLEELPEGVIRLP